MNKKIIFISFIFLLFYSININNKIKGNIYPSEVYLIFDKTEYLENEKVKLTINLAKFANLSEVKLRININNEYLEPIVENNEYFYLNYSSIFNSYIINDYIENEYLRLHLIKENDIVEGYYSGVKNSLCEVCFNVKKDINNIEDIINIDDVSLYLFNIDDELIDYQIFYSNKIKIKVNQKQYDINVFNELPDFNNEVKVLNRSDEEYEIYLEENIDTSIIGIKVLLLAIYDLTNADYVTIPITINIIDNECPIIEYPLELLYLDNEYSDKTFLEDIKITDNYDNNLIINISYYNKEKEKMDKNEFYHYLSFNLEGYISIKVSDQSNNSSVSDKINIKIIDQTCPEIAIINSLEIIDTDIESFEFEANLSVNDKYDENPCLIVKYYNMENNEIDDYKKELLTGRKVIATYYGIDEFNNKTEEIKCIITPIDLTIPIIHNIKDIEINDYELYNTDFFEGIYASDNFDKNLSIIKTYYILDEYVSYKDFLEKLSKGLKGCIKYQTKDYSNNLSIEYIQNIIVFDTTPPDIKIENVKNDEKYIYLENIKYSVSDNFENEIKIEVYLNDLIYNNEEIMVPGEYKIFIKAVDESNNISEYVLKFTIIEDNIIGCGTDAVCYYNNYSELIVIVCAVLSIGVAIVVGQLIIKVNKKKKM